MMNFPEIIQTDWTTAPNRYVKAAGISFAFRELGVPSGTPAILLNHWGANLDNFDPRIVNGLASSRPVFTLDYRGIGASEGQAPLTVDEMANDVIAIIRRLGFSQVDLIGFSLGGFVAQDVTLKAPDLIRRLILAATGPAGGKDIDKIGIVSWPLIIKGLLTLRDPKTYLFFTSSNQSRRAARAFLERLKERKDERDKPVSLSAFRRQLQAIREWGTHASQDLSTIHQPVLVINGDHDIMVPTSNSITLSQRLPNAELVIYEDAGHGSIFQYHSAFVRKMHEFLEQ